MAVVVGSAPLRLDQLVAVARDHAPADLVVLDIERHGHVANRVGRGAVTTAVKHSASVKEPAA